MMPARRGRSSSAGPRSQRRPWAPWRCLEGRLRRLRDRDDGVLPAALADQQRQRRDPQGPGRVLQQRHGQYRAARRRRRRARRHDRAAERGAATADLAVRPPRQLPTLPEDRGSARGRIGGSPGAATTPTVPPRREAPARAQPARPGGSTAPRPPILAALQATPELRGFKDSLLIEQTPEGLRIQLLDRDAAADVPGRQRRHVPAYPPAAEGGGAGDRRAAEPGLDPRPHRCAPFAAGAGNDNWQPFGRSRQRHADW